MNKFWAELKLVGLTDSEIIKKSCGCIIPKGQFTEYGLYCTKHLKEVRQEQAKYDLWIKNQKPDKKKKKKKLDHR